MSVCYLNVQIQALGDNLRANIKDEVQRKIMLRARIDKETSDTEQAAVYAKEQEEVVSFFYRLTRDACD